MRFGAEHCIGNRWIKLARIVACLKVAQWIRKAGLKSEVCFALEYSRILQRHWYRASLLENRLVFMTSVEDHISAQ